MEYYAPNPSALLDGGGDISVLGAAAEGAPDVSQTPPASPTAPLPENNSAEELQSPSRKRQGVYHRTVRFDSETKQHDGLSERAALLDNIIKRFFVLRQEISEFDVIELCSRQAETITALHEDIAELVSRLKHISEEADARSVPVLAQGGGYCTKLCAAHLPYLETLNRVVDASGKRLLRSS